MKTLSSIESFLLSISIVNLLLIALFLFVLFFALIIAKWRLFKKCNIPGWKSIIPFYNNYIMITQIAKLHWAYFVALLILSFISLSEPVSTIVTLLVWGVTFRNIGLLFHKDEVPSAIFGAILPIIVTAVFGLSDWKYDPAVEVNYKGVF